MSFLSYRHSATIYLKSDCGKYIMKGKTWQYILLMGTTTQRSTNRGWILMVVYHFACQILSYDLCFSLKLGKSCERSSTAGNESNSIAEAASIFPQLYSRRTDWAIPETVEMFQLQGFWHFNPTLPKGL